MSGRCRAWSRAGSARVERPITPLLVEPENSTSDGNRGNLGGMRNKGAMVVKTMKPGDPGTRRQLARWGSDLLCVRYRYDEARHERLTTVEIVVDRGVRAAQVEGDRYVGVRLRYEETPLRQEGRAAGARGAATRNLWLLPGSGALRIGLGGTELPPGPTPKLDRCR